MSRTCYILSSTKTYFFFFLIFTFSIPSFGQEVSADGFDFKFKRVIKNSRLFEFHTSGYFVQAGKNEQKIQCRLRVKSSSGKRGVFDPNKFFLLSDRYKVRLRPVDMKHNYVAGSYQSFGMLVDHKPSKKYTFYHYNPDIVDTFFDYAMEGYQDIDNSLNFGTERKPDTKSIFYNHKKLRSNVVDVYFIVPKTFNIGTLYYGSTLITTFDLRK